MLTLREYQVEAIQAVADGYRRGIRRPLIGLPTGTGKTIIFSAIVQGSIQKGRRALILAHRDELLSQARQKLCDVAPELEMSIGLVKAKTDEHDRDVVIASVQTLARQARRDRITRPFDVVIVDEAHHAAAVSYQNILDHLGSFSEDGPLTIGVTATPQRADSKNLGDTWEEVVYHRDILSMMRAGYLCDLRGISVRLGGLDLGGVRTTAGDYNEADLEVALDAADAPTHGVQAWLKYCLGRKTIVFTPTIKLAHDTARAFREAGIRAHSLSGLTPLEERRDMLRSFHLGDIQVIANAQVLTEGFDEPSVECIMLARPTKSQPLYVQMIGRGTRIHPGKTDCIVLDIVGATERHDLQTLPKLFGLSDEDDQAVVVDADTEAVDGGSVMDHVERDVRLGKITARQVELFKRQDLAWVRARDGLWVLSLGQETVHLTAQDGRWNVTVRGKNMVALRTLETGLEQGYAMGVAEDYARTSGSFAQTLVSKAAGWRREAATSKQVAAMRRFGLRPASGLTRGEASDLLAAAIAVRGK